jgi:hypothetical protein
VSRRAAALYGAAASLAVLLLGELLVALRAAGPLEPSALDVIRAGALVPSLVHGAPVEILLTEPAFGGTGLAAGLRYGFEVRVALLLGTGLAGWLLFRGGRRAAGTEAGWARGALGAALVAGPYVLLSLAAALVARGSDPALLLGRAFAGLGQSEATPSLGWSVALASVLALACGAAGALSATGRPRTTAGLRIRAALGGGWRMAWVAAAGGVAGLLVVVALHPGTTRSFFDAAAARGPAGVAVALLGALLLLPDAGVGAAAAAMGAPIELHASGATCAIVSYGRLGGGQGECGSVAVGPLGAAYALFVAVPLAAVLAGGWWAASRLGHAPRVAAAAAAGSLAGIPFAALLTVACAVASPAWEVVGPVAGALGGGLRLGPPLPAVVVLGLAWGVAGGGVGGALQARLARRRKETDRARG